MTPLISGLASLASLLFNASQSGSGKAAAPRRNGESADAGPSAKVSLSQEAQALAGLAGLGATFAPAVVPAGLESVRVSADGVPGRVGADLAVSSEDFQALLERFGASSEQKKLLTEGFDTDKNGTISRAEFLQGLGRTARKGGGGGDGDRFSQALLTLMDKGGDANASVSKQEFAAFTTAFAAATQGRRA